MSDYDDNDDGQTQLSIEDLRNLRNAAKERDTLSAQVNAQNRELAFARAKIDIDDPKLKYFVKGYEGDLTPEAIRAQAEADGFFQKSQAVDNRQDMAGQQRIANASSGAGETATPDLAAKLRDASSQEEVMALMIEAGYPTSWNRL